MPLWIQCVMSCAFVFAGVVGLLNLIVQDRSKQNGWTIVQLIHYFAYLIIGTIALVYLMGSPK